MKQIKLLDRFDNPELDDAAKEQITKAFAYGKSDDNLEFIEKDIPFTEGSEQYVGYFTFSGALKELDVDDILKEAVKEQNANGTIRTVRVDVHNRSIRRVDVNEYPLKED